MKFYYFDSKFTDKKFKDLLEFVTLNHDSDITIFLISDGGSSEIAQMILHLISENPERFTVVAGTICSSAFQVFYMLPCQKKIVSGAMGMYHQGSVEIDLCDNGKPSSDYHRAVMLNNKEFHLPDGLAFAEKFMTPAELRQFKIGKEVWLYYYRMKEIFGEKNVF